jgi:hypothetical protein
MDWYSMEERTIIWSPKHDSLEFMSQREYACIQQVTRRKEEGRRRDVWSLCGPAGELVDLLTLRLFFMVSMRRWMPVA